jgi:hypothetical protein
MTNKATNRRRELDDLLRTWRPPVELLGTGPREVRLSKGGIAVACLAGVFFVGSIAAAIGLSRVAAREARETAALETSGVETQALVTRHWRTGDKDSKRKITYRFQHDGRSYTASATTPRKIWERLAVGSTLPVRYVPSDPVVNHPAEWPGRDMAPWLPGLIAVVLIGVGMFLVWIIRRQSQLLSDGRPAPAIVVSHTRMKHGQILKYEFPLLHGGTAKGSGGQSRRPPPVGSTICIVYDRDNPKRNSPYPFDLVRVSR